MSGKGAPEFRLFGTWDTTGIEVADKSLGRAISLRQVVMPVTYGRSALKRFNKEDAHIVERLANKMMHFGKRYAKNTGRMAGKKMRTFNTIKAAFTIIELKTGRNPVEVLVRAVEHSAPNEDTTRIVYGGTVYRAARRTGRPLPGKAHIALPPAPLRRPQRSHGAPGARRAFLHGQATLCPRQGRVRSRSAAWNRANF